VIIYFWQHAQDLHNAVKYRVIYMRQHKKIFSTMTNNFIVSLVCLFVFLQHAEDLHHADVVK